MEYAYFVVLTTYQLYVADVYANYIAENYKNVTIKIFMVGMENFDIGETNYEIIKIPDMNKSKWSRLIQRLVWAGRLFFTTPIYRYFHNINSCNLFVFNDNEPITNKIIRMIKKSKTNKVIIIEEGIGMYEKTVCQKLNVKQRCRLFFTTVLGSPMQYKAVGESKYISYAIVGDADLYRGLDKAKNQIVLEQSKKYIYSQASNFLRILGLSCEEYKDFYVIYIGQPMNENGLMTFEEEDYINKLIRFFDRILIKPHPRDYEGKYDRFCKGNNSCRVMDATLSILPFESIIASLDVKIVISMTSSAGVNIARTFPNIRSVFTYDMIEANKCFELIDNGYTEMNRELFVSPYNNILIPKSLNELRVLLSDTNNDISTSNVLETEFQLPEIRIVME